MAITAAMVKELREKTGAGMMDCKKALTENDGNVDAAVKFLREKGLAAAAKKAGRVAAEGLVGTHVNGTVAALLEVNCETDFVAKNDDFQNLVADLTEHVVTGGADDVDAMNEQKFFKDDSKSVADIVTDKIATIGEKISLRRLNRFEGGDVYGAYAHAGGSIGVLVELKLSDNAKAGDESLKVLAKDLAMHVASEAPISIKREDVPAETVEAERAIFKQQALDSGKPEKIVDKIVDGRINKFFAESVLLEQQFVKDPDLTVKKLMAKVGGELGTDIELSRFARFKVGEGIEKKQDNLAEEVAKMTAS
jgi:elongation factor Ts